MGSRFCGPRGSTNGSRIRTVEVVGFEFRNGKSGSDILGGRENRGPMGGSANGSPLGGVGWKVKGFGAIAAKEDRRRPGREFERGRGSANGFLLIGEGGRC